MTNSNIIYIILLVKIIGQLLVKIIGKKYTQKVLFAGNSRQKKKYFLSKGGSLCGVEQVSSFITKNFVTAHNFDK